MRGVHFSADGRQHVLRYSVNALVRLEDATGRSVAEMAAMLGDGARMSDLRTMFWAGLSDVTPEQAGDIMDEIGIERAAQMIGEAFQAAFPAADGGAGNGAAAAG